MKRIRANDIGSELETRTLDLGVLGLALCITVMNFTLLAGSGQAAEPTLAPLVLFDTDEIATYLDEFPKDDYQIVEVPDLGRFYIDDNPALVKKTLLSGKPWEPYVIEALEKHLSPGDTVLDIGAHIGSLTVPIARLIGPTGTVFAFEPQRKIYRELVYNLELNELSNAVPLRFALSSKTEIVEMDPAVANDGQVRVGKGGDKVEARPIDSFGFSDVALMKIDVEGHEAEILRGAVDTIGALHPVIIIEIWRPNLKIVMPMLESYGYTVRPISFMDYIATYEPESKPQPKRKARRKPRRKPEP